MDHLTASGGQRWVGQFAGWIAASFFGLALFAPVGAVIAAVGAYRWKGPVAARAVLAGFAVYVILSLLFATKLSPS